MSIPTIDSAVSWATKPYPEIRSLAERDGSILVIPVGSVEQHGNHLPVATDTLLADAVATAGAERVAEDVPVLVTPPIWSGYSPHHMALGGTLTLSFDGLRTVVEDIADAALDNGFDAVLLLNGHGGNVPLVGAAVSELGDRHPEAEVTGVTYFDLAAPFVDKVRESDVGGMAHAGEFETSLMLHLYPELVGDDREATTWETAYDLAPKDMFDGGPLAAYRTFDEYSATGAVGAPDLATVRKGEQLFDGLRDELGALLTAVHEQCR